MIVARFNGVCPDCRMPIRIGDKLGKHNGKWAHIQCPPRRLPDTRHADPMARFDAEIQKREQDADQRAFEAKMDAESRLNEEVSCQAPNVTRFYERPSGRCCLPLGPVEPLYGNTRETGRRCPKGHFSFLCGKCGRTTFAVTSAPPEEHETFCSTYCCRACGEPVWSDEGLDGHLGEVQMPETHV